MSPSLQDCRSNTLDEMVNRREICCTDRLEYFLSKNNASCFGSLSRNRILVFGFIFFSSSRKDRACSGKIVMTNIHRVRNLAD
jgi:hypothetical protein